jgi:hypothetical protein
VYIFAIERQWNGELVGSAGPLVEGQLWPLAKYEYTPERNDWIKDNNDKLILFERAENGP